MSATEEALAPVVTSDQLDLVTRTVAAGATKEELALYLFDCKRLGVHPLDKLLHFTKRAGRYTPITSIDLMRSRAAETGELAGIEDAEFEGDGVGAPRTAKVTVYRITQGQRYAYTATARWSEYYPGDGPQGQMWRKMSHTMLGKCAEALALRKAFPRSLHGLYEGAEMDQAAVAGALPVKAAPLVDGEPGLPEPAADGSVLVWDVAEKAGGKPGQKAWTMYTVVFDDRREATTFDANLGKDAQRYLTEGTRVIPTLEQKGKYLNLTALLPVEAPGPVADALADFDAEVIATSTDAFGKIEHERETLNAEVVRLGDKLKLKGPDRAQFWSTYVGTAMPHQADLGGLNDLVKALKTRAGEAA